MNELPETWVLCEADERFLKSLRIAGNDWRNTNQRFRDDYHAHKSDFRADRNCAHDWTVPVSLGVFVGVCAIIVIAWLAQ